MKIPSYSGDETDSYILSDICPLKTWPLNSNLLFSYNSIFTLSNVSTFGTFQNPILELY